MYQLFIDLYVYIHFFQGSNLRVTILLQLHIYNLYTNIYIYIYMPCTVSRAATPSPSLSSNRPLGLPSGVDGNNLTKLVRLSYND